VSSSIDSWEVATGQVRLHAGEVHVWRAPLTAGDAELARFAATLSEDERARAARFRFERDRRRFTVGRGILRALLGAYLPAPPQSLAFTYNEYGRPELVASGDPPLCFNVSHSDELALYGFALGRQLGIDVEWMRAEVSGEEIARRFFAPGEVERLFRLAPAARMEAFFACWTRKEAYIKAKSRGLSLPLADFEVTLGPDEPAVLLSARWDPEEASRWSLVELPVDPGYKAALAVQGGDWTLRRWEWRGDVERHT
jgi:4'-phosphopantetheinyl transferase